MILVTFFILAVLFTNYGLNSLHIAGGLPSMSTISLLVSHPFEMLNLFLVGITSGSGIYATTQYILAWVSLIAGSGFWWLTVLGLRWLYHTILRAVFF